MAAAGTAAGTADEGNCAGADDDDGPDTGSDEAEVAKVPGVCVEPAILLDSDVSVFWPLVAAMPTETPTATVRVPAAMRAGRFHFRGLLAGDWSLMTFSLPGAGTFRV